MLRNLFLVVFTTFFLGGLSAQNYIGTEFRFACLKNIYPFVNTPPIFDVSIHALEDLNATVEYGVPGDSFYQIQTISINAGGVGVVSFDQNEFLNQENLNVVETRSFLVSCSGMARVFAFHNRLYFAESSPILPTNSLGTDYMIATFDDSDGGLSSIFNIIGTADNTLVNVTPSAPTVFGGAGTTFSLTLNEGEVISISSGDDLSGSRVSSAGAPIAVSSGHEQTLIGIPNCNATSHLWEQLIPISDWRTVYPIFPLEGNGGDLFRVVALSDNTELYDGCDLLATINEGEIYEDFIQNPFMLSSSDPVSVIAVLRGTNCSGNGLGDPNMRLILPLESGNEDVKVRVNYPVQEASFGTGELNVVHLVMPTAEITDLALNGAQVTNWQTFDDYTSFSYAEVSIPDLDDLLSIQSVSPFWGELLTLKPFDAFTMSLGSASVIDLPISAVPDLGPDQTLCSGQSLILTTGTGTAGTWQDGTVQETYTVNQPGTYSVSIPGSCNGGNDEVEITAGLEPTITLPAEITLCGGESEQLTVATEPSVTYTWSNGDLGPTADVDQIGSITLTATSVDGCVATASVDVNEGLEIDLGSDQSLCDGESLILTTGTGTAGTWQDGTVQ
ncbi:MAG: IgGFc-binding protein, partial [Bacteroidota bacterium]